MVLKIYDFLSLCTRFSWFSLHPPPCAPKPSTLARSKERKGSNFAFWQPCWPSNLGVVYPPLEQSSSPGRSGSTQEAHQADSRDSHGWEEGEADPSSAFSTAPPPPPPAELQLLRERLRRLLLLLLLPVAPPNSSAAVSSL